jgi:hypothetical protein
MGLGRQTHAQHAFVRRWRVYLLRMPTYAETMANAYKEARLKGSKICDRKKLEAYWEGKTEWFSDQLARAWQIEADLEAMNISVPSPLSEASRTLMRIVEDCQKQYELHA